MKKEGLLGVLVLFSLVILGSAIVYAASSSVPTSPDSITETSSGRWGGTSSISLEAEAGNVTELLISHRQGTESWQGYYGNITGTITLDDANNNSMFDWTIPTPTGEIYASNGSSVTWANIMCVNFTTDKDAFNETILERGFGINSTDLDGFSETFNNTYTNATGFEVGSVQINTDDSCPSLFTYVDGTYQTDTFEEVLLTDNVSVIFTALLENDADGFKQGDNTSDFQMLVAENGHVGFEDTTTTYYFFVELA